MFPSFFAVDEAYPASQVPSRERREPFPTSIIYSFN